MLAPLRKFFVLLLMLKFNHFDRQFSKLYNF